MNIHGRHSNFGSWSLERNHQKLKWVKTNGWSIVSRYVTVFEEKFKFFTDLSDLFLKDEASGRLQASDQLIPNLSKLTLLPYDAQMSKLAGEALIYTSCNINCTKQVNCVAAKSGKRPTASGILQILGPSPCLGDGKSRSPIRRSRRIHR